MNAVHIIREALVNTTWGGLGYPEADLDADSFTTAANTALAEGIGLSIVWGKDSSVEDFICILS